MYAKSVLILFVLAAVAHGSTIQIPLVTVGDPGNVADPLTGYGSVSYVYQMGEFDVTTAQYTTFLNAVATTDDPYGLYTVGMATDLPTVGITRTSSSGTYCYAIKGNGNVPVFDVSWGDAVRFVNWLANDQPTAPKRRTQPRREPIRSTAERATRADGGQSQPQAAAGFCPGATGLPQPKC